MSESTRPEQPKTARHTVRVEERRWLSGRTFELRLSRPPAFSFLPGQRIRFLYDNRERDYSLASSPEAEQLRLCIRRVENGFLTPQLAAMALPAELELYGPLGYFTFRSGRRPPVFVATGTGISPFVSMAEAGASGFVLLHGVPGESELYYRDVLEAAADLYVPCLSQTMEGAEGLPDAYRGRVTAYLSTRLPAGAYDFYLCGCQAMVRDAVLVIDERFPGSLVYTEVFY